MRNMKTKSINITYLVFLGLALLSALRYFYLGQWKNYVALFAIVELFVVLISAILFIIKRTRFKTQKYAYMLLGIMQFFPMVVAFGLSGQYTIYGVFHLLMIAWCVSMLFVMFRKKNGGAAA